MVNALNWFEIPATDISRAIKFYSTIFGYENMQSMDFGGFKMAFFPMEGEGVGGALCQCDGYKPSQEGALIYLNGGLDLANSLSKVEASGGKIILQKRQISEEYGYMALFIDSEGNRVALHSMK